MAQKPDKDEFMSAVKITALGIAIVGIIGFVIFLLYEFSIGQTLLGEAAAAAGA